MDTTFSLWSKLMLILVFLPGCTLHPRRFDDCCWYLNREDTKVERAEQIIGSVLTIGGFLSYVPAFFIRDFTVAGSALGACGFGVLLMWDGAGAFQGIGTCYPKPGCGNSDRRIKQ